MVARQRKLREFERREQEILDAALHLFAGDNWESVTVVQIAEQAGIGKGTVYKHFASKDEIIARLALDFFFGLLNNCREMPDGDDPAADLRSAFRAALNYHEQHQQYRNVRQFVFRAGFWQRLSPRYVEEFERLDAEFTAWASGRIQRGIDAGAFQQQPMEPLLAGLDALFNGAVSQLWGDRCWMKVEPAEYIEGVIDFAMQALQAREQSA
jgi:AcrR family transcriptional regulator